MSAQMLVLLLFLTFIIQTVSAASPADEFLLDRVYNGDGSPGKFMDITGFRIKRHNRTSFLVGGDLILKQPLDNEISAKISIIGVDQGGDKYLVTRQRDTLCSFLVKNCTHCKGLFETAGFQPEIKKCPVEPGKYTMPMIPVARKRKDWPVWQQVVIPPLVPFENYKLNMKFYRDTELLDEFIIAFRLVNELSAV